MTKLNKNTKIIFWLVLLFLFIFVSILSISFHYTSPDGIQYLSLGYNLFHHGIYDCSYGIVPSWVQSPMFPILLGIFSIIIPIEICGKIVGLLALVIILVLLYKLIQSEFNEMLAWIGIVVLSINVLFFRQALITTTEPVYTAINLGIFIILYKIYRKKIQISWTKVSLLGVLSVLMMLTRPEGILYVILIIILFLKLKIFYFTIFYISLVVLLTIPYGVFIDSKMGEYNLFPKIKYNKRIGSFIRQEIQENPKLFDESDYLEQIAWYSLDTADTEIFSQKIMDDKYYTSLIKKNENEDIQKNSFKLFILRIRTNIIKVLRILIIGYHFPIVFLIFILLGLVYLFRHDRQFFYFMLLWIFISFYFIISHVDGRFFYVMLPYCSILAAFGIKGLCENFKIKERILYISLILLLINNIYYFKNFVNFLSVNEKYYSFAQKVKKIIPQPAKICSRNFSISFFSGHSYAKMPLCSPNLLHKYLVKKNVEYLLLGDEVHKYRKEFLSVFNTKHKQFFQLMNNYWIENVEFRIFKIN